MSNRLVSFKNVPNSITALPRTEESSNRLDGVGSVGSDGSDRRGVIVNIILDHYLSGGRGRLKLVDVADRAGISRQALDRYYSDLKPYIAGKRDVADLANGNAQKAQVQTQTAINAVENKYLERIERLMVDHVKALEKAENSHITSLMNADLVLLESNKMRIALEKQTLHNAELLKQIHALELKLSLPGGPTGAQTSGTPQQDKLAFDVDIETLCVSFQRGMSFEDFEVAKSAEIKKVREKLDKYQDTPNVHVVIFADRYISRFRTFVDRYRATEEELSLIVRLPLFSRSEVQSFIRNLPSDFRKSIHTPYLSLDSERKAQRVFIYQKFPLPPMEIKGADTADTPNMLWGFDTVVTYKIKQGD